MKGHRGERRTGSDPDTRPDRPVSREPHHAPAGVPRYLASDFAPAPALERRSDPSPDPGADAREATVVQRQETPSAPAVPSFQLTPPSLLQPEDPYAAWMPRSDFRLRTDPELQAWILARAQLQLDPGAVLARVAPVAPVVTAHPADPSGERPRPPAPGYPATPGGPGAAPPPGSGSTSPVGPTAPPPSTPPPSPPSPDAYGPTEPVPSPDARPLRAGSGGDVVSAVLATSQVATMLERVQTGFTGGFSTWWGGASGLDQGIFVSSSVLVTGTTLAPLLGFEEPRDFVLPLLNDMVLPVPGLSGYGLEFRFGERDVMVGAHLDVGLLLPSVWNFGPASWEEIGGPPGLSPDAAPPPLYPRRTDSREPSASGAELGARVEAARGGGDPLPEADRRRVAAHLDDDLDRVRLHSDARADALARDTGARALTSGRDVFFRQGSRAPGSAEGARLLAHELVHVDQQARGDLPPLRPEVGVRMSEPGDRLEAEAERVAHAVDPRDAVELSEDEG